MEGADLGGRCAHAYGRAPKQKRPVQCGPKATASTHPTWDNGPAWRVKLREEDTMRDASLGSGTSNARRGQCRMCSSQQCGKEALPCNQSLVLTGCTAGGTSAGSASSAIILRSEHRIGLRKEVKRARAKRRCARTSQCGTESGCCTSLMHVTYTTGLRHVKGCGFKWNAT